MPISSLDSTTDASAGSEADSAPKPRSESRDRGAPGEANHELATLRRELKYAQREARRNDQRALRFKRELVDTRRRLATVQRSPEMRIGRVLTKPVRVVEASRNRRRLSRIPTPTFVIIGAQKAGTRWLRYNLGLHPDVLSADIELNYFNSSAFNRGINWYRLQYSDWSGQRALGEATPGYMLWRSRPEVVAGRIHERLPEARLFAVLRDPCDRVLSAFMHHARRERIPADTDLVEYVRSHPPEEERFQLVPGGWYAASLEPYFDRFGDQLKVFLNEDLSSDPVGVYRRSLEHIGVDPEFVPGELAQVRFSNPVPENSRYQTSEGKRRSLNEEERRALYPYFAEDIDRLEQMLGRDLSGWRPQA